MDPQGIDRNQSFWFSTITLDEPNRLAQSLKSDIAIVGGGLLGLSTAYHLNSYFPDRRIILVEARRIANGASGRNGGHVLPLSARATFQAMKGLSLKNLASDETFRGEANKLPELK